MDKITIFKHFGSRNCIEKIYIPKTGGLNIKTIEKNKIILEMIKEVIANHLPSNFFFLICTKLIIAVIKPINAKIGTKRKTPNPNNTNGNPKTYLNQGKINVKLNPLPKGTAPPVRDKRK